MQLYTYLKRLLQPSICPSSLMPLPGLRHVSQDSCMRQTSPSPLPPCCVRISLCLSWERLQATAEAYSLCIPGPSWLCSSASVAYSRLDAHLVLSLQHNLGRPSVSSEARSQTSPTTNCRKSHWSLALFHSFQGKNSRSPPPLPALAIGTA